MGWQSSLPLPSILPSIAVSPFLAAAALQERGEEDVSINRRNGEEGSKEGRKEGSRPDQCTTAAFGYRERRWLHPRRD